MDEITLSATINDEKKLVLDLPEEAPRGPVEVTIRSTGQQNQGQDTDRTVIRKKLEAAHFLVTGLHRPADVQPLRAEQILERGTLTPDARPSEELIDEDRGSV